MSFYRLGLCAALAAVVLVGCSTSASLPASSMAGRSTTIMRTKSNERPQGSVTHYFLIALATLGGKQSGTGSINARNQTTGFSWLKGNIRAALWRTYRETDLGTLGGPNSGILNFNHGTRGQFVGMSQVSQTDPNDENFCGFITFTSHICLGFSWRNGKMTPLPTLGGNNGEASDVNNRGQIVGVAETNTIDPNCPVPQVLDYYGVIWQPNGQITTLPPYSGDTVSEAFAMNGAGQSVGYSGPCGLIVHAVVWQNGSTINLRGLRGAHAIATDINNRGQIVGASLTSEASGAEAHAVLWQDGRIRDLGTLPGDLYSNDSRINDKGQIVGESCPASGPCRGFIWQNGTMTDLNTLTPPKTKLYVTSGNDINNSGQIVGRALNPKGYVRAVVLVPGRKADGLPNDVSPPKIAVPETPLMQLRSPRVAPFGRFPHLTAPQ